MKKKNKIPFVLRCIRWAMPKLEVVSPALAGNWGVKLFMTPFRTYPTAYEKEVLEQASVTMMEHKGEQLHLYHWQNEGPNVLFLHGWAGRGLQGAYFAESLRHKGYNVFSLDFPAHGASSGKQTNVVEMTEVVHQLTRKWGGFHAVIGHSLGGIVTLNSMSEGLMAERVVLIGVPADSAFIVEQFLEKIRGGKVIEKALYTYIQKKFQRDFHEFDALNIVKRLPKKFPTLVIHDDKDREVPVDLSKRLNFVLPDSRMVLTKGWGHSRILSNPEVVMKVEEFISQGEIAQTIQEEMNEEKTS
ncbi:alpha/beta hydrolase [Rapidithrix thailandica]|uniref:Alpha/beta hydrolase n=1 Tax=Rapidithrix thailandica TaxID=413964 RepID=A0AAW9SBX2_9BACT